MGKLADVGLCNRYGSCLLVAFLDYGRTASPAASYQYACGVSRNAGSVFVPGNFGIGISGIWRYIKVEKRQPLLLGAAASFDRIIVNIPMSWL